MTDAGAFAPDSIIKSTTLLRTRRHDVSARAWVNVGVVGLGKHEGLVVGSVQAHGLGGVRAGASEVREDVVQGSGRIRQDHSSLH